MAIFNERYATREEWVTWFHVSRDSRIDNISYAEVMGCKSTVIPNSSTSQQSLQLDLNSPSTTSYKHNALTKTNTYKILLICIKLPNPAIYHIFLAVGSPCIFQLNIPNCRKYLANYWDHQLMDLLTFGFPLDFDHSCPLETTESNHGSAKCLLRTH